MLLKTCGPTIATPSQKQLEALYAQRKAIEALIESLEQYDQLRARLGKTRKQKNV